MEDTDAPHGSGSIALKRGWWWLVALGGLGVVAIAVFWFQPQKLYLDDLVSEPVPVDDRRATAGASSPAPGVSGAPPTEELRGTFISIDHPTRGEALVLDLGAGRKSLRLKGLDTDNGPDLYVYLSASPADGEEGAFDDDFVNLGRLKGNVGDQNYDLPTDVDLRRYVTVVVWCDRFNSAFGAAALT